MAPTEVLRIKAAMAGMVLEEETRGMDMVILRTIKTPLVLLVVSLMSPTGETQEKGTLTHLEVGTEEMTMILLVPILRMEGGIHDLTISRVVILTEIIEEMIAMAIMIPVVKTQEIMVPEMGEQDLSTHTFQKTIGITLTMIRKLQISKMGDLIEEVQMGEAEIIQEISGMDQQKMETTGKMITIKVEDLLVIKMTQIMIDMVEEMATQVPMILTAEIVMGTDPSIIPEMVLITEFLELVGLIHLEGRIMILHTMIPIIMVETKTVKSLTQGTQIKMV